VGDAVLGDLHEAYVARVAEDERRASFRARVWYWQQVATMGAPYLLRRLGRRSLYRDLHDRFVPSGPRGGLTDGIPRDLRFGARSLLRDRTFTSVAVLTLGLGIGATASMFSVVNAVLLRPLPFPEPHRLVFLRDAKAPDYLSGIQVAPGHFAAWRDRSTSFEGMGAYQGRRYTLTGVADPMRLEGARVSAGLLPLLGVHPAFGRHFGTDEEEPGRDRVVLISHRLWEQDFGGDPSMVGRSLLLDGQSHTVVGILPPGFEFPDPAIDLWTPLAMTLEDAQVQGNHYLWVVARLRGRVTMEQARGEMDGLARQLETEHPRFNAGWGVRLDGLLESRVGERKLALWTLLGAVAFVLLIACANVANMLLARSAGRRREMGVRAAMGAGPGMLLRQALAESALLGAGGGVLGVLFASWGVSALPAIASDVPRIEGSNLDLLSLGVVAGVVVLATLLFGIVQAAQAFRSDLTAGLKDMARGSSSGPRRQGLRRLLVVFEVTLALVLLTGAGLLIRSHQNLREVDPGFRPEQALVAHIELPGATYTPGPETAGFFRQLTDGVSGLPGVEAAGVAFTLPFIRDQHLGFSIQGRPPVESDRFPSALYYAVSPGYFRAMGIPLVRGRLFTSEDREGTPGVILINRAMAERHFPGQDPIGERIHLTNGPVSYRKIVGVVGDVRQSGLHEAARDQVYEPFSQQTYQDLDMWLVARSAADPTALSGAVRKLAQELEGDLFLAALGVYGVMSYSVAQRTREVGIRVALGARRPTLVAWILAEGLSLTALGLAGGLLVALPMTRVMEGMLFGVGATDPVTLALSCLALTATAGLATALPVHRATRVDPNVALRSE
jgi:putative ABC transport system permease protein